MDEGLVILCIIGGIATIALFISFLYNISKMRENTENILKLLEVVFEEKGSKETGIELPSKSPFTPSGKMWKKESS